MDFGSFTSVVENWPTDWIILGAFAALAAFDTLRAGSSRVAALSLALPISAVTYGEISHTFPISSFLTQISSPVVQGALFAILLVIFFLLMRRIVGLWGDLSAGPLPALIAGLACAVIAITIWLQIPILDSLWHFGTHVQAIFGQDYRLSWLLGAFAALAYVRS